jgi:hypothetical protein
MLSYQTRRVFPCTGLVLLACACSPGRMDVVGLSPNSLSLGLVALWPCDQVAGTTLADKSGNGHDGTVDGATWIDGRFGGGLRFEAESSAVVPGFPQATRRFSVALWYRPLAGGELDDSYRALLGTEIVPGGGWQLSIRRGPSRSLLRFEYPTGADGSVSMERMETDLGGEASRWRHITAVVDGDALRVALYRDGTLVAEQSTGASVQPGSAILTLGRSVGGEQSLEGDVDDIAIFSRALVAGEVAKLATEPAPEP